MPWNTDPSEETSPFGHDGHGSICNPTSRSTDFAGRDIISHTDFGGRTTTEVRDYSGNVISSENSLFPNHW